jgi:hypothetical protein
MGLFARLMRLEPGQRILDLGGQPGTWQYVSQPLDITMLNLPDRFAKASSGSHHRFSYVRGDACDVERFQDNEFDVVFSNSVIEHVGPENRQQSFAREVRRLGGAYWVQTPSKWFPVEAHCGMPFWWFYPEFVRHAVIRRWQRKLPGWTRMIAGTRVLSRQQMQGLFPEATILVEYSFGLPKSYVAYSDGNGGEPRQPI